MKLKRLFLFVCTVTLLVVMASSCKEFTGSIFHGNEPDTVPTIRCHACNGSGERSVDCPKCKGKSRVNCPYCNNSKVRTCNSCKGSGKVECNFCLGRGQKVCQTCNATGIFNGWTHSTCNGRGFIVCKNCEGYGEKHCSDCYGSGKKSCNRCYKDGIPCDNCDQWGTVRTKCNVCDGLGFKSVR